MIKRHITSLIINSLHEFPAVLLNGARQVGKSTLTQELVGEGILAHYITLDDLTSLEAARYDADGFLKQFSGAVVIDEVQRAPDLLRALKKNIDQNRQVGRFLLTGSANMLAHPHVSESLAGRIDIINLEGLSLGEIEKQKKPSPFLKDIFSDYSTDELAAHWRRYLKTHSSFYKNQLYEKVFFGGFPEVVLKHNEEFSQRWFNAYHTAYIERDVRDLSRLLEIVSFSKLFRLVGLQTGNLVNVKSLSMEANIDQRTTQRYLEILDITFQIKQLQPWFSNIRKRLVKTAKFYINDSGMACYLAGVNSAQQLAQHPMVGSLVETWVFSELRKLLALETGIETHFYRTHQGKEVDFVLTKGTQLVGIEFKLAEKITAKDFAGLYDILDSTKRFKIGILLYTGQSVIKFSDNLLAVPISVLI